MKKILLTSALCVSMMLAANADYQYEITPMFGGTYSEGNLDLKRNQLNGGLSFGINQQNSMIDQIEIGFLNTIEDIKYRDGSGKDTDITRIFTNIVKDYPLTTDTSLYALVGIGYEMFSDERAGNEDSMFGNYGVGIRYKVADEFHLKFDIRHLVETDNADNNLIYNFGFAFPFGKIAKMAPVMAAPAVVEAKNEVMIPKDSDGDGVIDLKDNCPDTMSGAQVDNVGCLTLVNLNINFDVDKSDIKDLYQSKILEFAEVLKKGSKLTATIEAHTDSTGSNSYNQKLSERRAKSAVDALKSLGIDSDRLSYIGYGETKPISSNETLEGRAENRRVTAVMNK